MRQEEETSFNPVFPVELLSLGHDTRYAKNTVICMQNEPAEKIFFLKEGEVCLSYYGENGERKIVFYVDKDSIFGGVISLVLNRKVYGVSAMTLTRSLVTVFSREVFFSTLINNIDFTRFCLCAVVKELWAMGSSLESLSFLECNRRVASALPWLTDHAGKVEKEESGELEHTFKITHQELGELASVNRVTVTNVLKELEKEKIILKGSKIIMIPAGGKQKLKRYIKNIWI